MEYIFEQPKFSYTVFLTSLDISIIYKLSTIIIASQCAPQGLQVIGVILLKWMNKYAFSSAAMAIAFSLLPTFWTFDPLGV